jgi:hypothetical protein
LFLNLLVGVTRFDLRLVLLLSHNLFNLSCVLTLQLRSLVALLYLNLADVVISLCDSDSVSGWFHLYSSIDASTAALAGGWLALLDAGGEDLLGERETHR